MTATTPGSEQILVRSSKTGERSLDQYIEDAEYGNRTLGELLGDLFDSTGAVDSSKFDMRINPSTKELELRFGEFLDPEEGWLGTGEFVLRARGDWTPSTAFKRLDLVAFNDGGGKDLYICTTDHTSTGSFDPAKFMLAVDGGSSAGGTVTEVNTGTGLTGGPITSTGTISFTISGMTTIGGAVDPAADFVPIHDASVPGVRKVLVQNLIPAASETASGIIELATNAEVQAGTDAVRAVTPAGLASRSGGLPTNDTLDTTNDKVAYRDATDGADKVTSIANFLSYVSAVPSGTMAMFAGAAAPSGWLLADGSAISRATFANLFAAIGTTWGAGDGSTTFNLPDMRGRGPIGVGTGTIEAAINSVNTSTDELTLSAANDHFYTGQEVVYATDGTVASPLVSGNTYFIIRISSTVVELATSRALADAGTSVNLTSAGTGNQKLTLTLTARALGDKGGEEEHQITTAELASHNHDLDEGSLAGSGISELATDHNGVNSVAIAPTGGDAPHNNMPPYLALNFIIKT